MDERLAEHAWIAGDRYTIADITTQVTVDFAKWIKLDIPQSAANLRRWFTAVSARPSAKA
jgi:glutathione S-transferase